MLFGWIWLYQLEWSQTWKPDSENKIVEFLYYWALGAFTCGAALRAGLIAWASRR
jgi:hypothetical protein